MDGMLTDLRYALRNFRRSPRFYAIVIAILATGIGCSVAIFSFGDGILIRPLPYRDPQRLVMLTSYATLPPFDSNGSVSYRDYLYFQGHAHSFADVAVTYRTGWSRVTLKGAGGPVPIQGAFVSPNLFALFGRQPLTGRTFTSDENRRAARVVLVTEGLAVERFGSPQGAIGQDVLLDKERWQIIGVMPADFRVPFLDTQLWAPVLSNPGWNDTEESNPLDRARWDLMARLKAGVTETAAQSEVDAIQKGLRAALPEFHKDSVRVVPLREHFTGKMRKPLMILASAVAFLWFIACANAANLLLARGSQRAREMAVRAALGAKRSRILRLLITESVLLACIAGAAGMILAFWLVPVLKTLAPSGTPLLDTVSLNARGLEFALLASLATGVLVGIAPVFGRPARHAGESLKLAARTSTEDRRSRRFKGVLVALEFAVAMVLLTGAGLLIRSLAAINSIQPGFHAANVLTVRFGLPNDTPVAQFTRFYRDAAERIKTVRGVEAVGGVSNLFFLSETRMHALRQVEEHPPEPKQAWRPLVWAQVTGDYFQAMGIPLIRGRFFTENDGPAAPPVAIINQTLARRYWPGEDPIGKHLKGFDPRGRHDDWLTVAGVVADTRSGGLERPPMSQIYEAQAQRGEQIGNLVVRTHDAARLAASVRSILLEMNPEATISSVDTVEQLLGRQEVQRRFQTWLISLFSGLALALASFGIFAAMHYSVVARRNEMGVRIALGADRSDITRLVLRDGARLAAAGVVAGIAASMWSSELLAGMLYEVKAHDPVNSAAAAFVLLVFAMLGAYLPARAASRSDPIAALRDE